jgi:hypothetical protein
MKKFLIILILIAAMVSTVSAGLVYDYDYYKKHISDLRSGGQNDPFRRHLVEASSILFPSSGDATIWYVNSNVTTEGDGTSWTNAKDTLDEAINLASAGDFIDVAEGHAESGSAANLWDADVAGITIRHYGNGNRQGTYTFADTDTTVSIGAADVTIYGGRLLAGISEVVVGMDVTAAADRLTVIGMEFPEPTTSTFEFNIAVQLTTGSDDVSFIGCKAYSADATGADHWLNGGAGAVNRLTLIGNTIIGEYAIAPIFSDQADLENFIAYNTVTNMTSAQHGIEYSGNATGWLRDNLVSTDAIGTSYDPGRMSDARNYWDDFDTYDTSAVPWTTNETGVNRWGATELAQIEGEATDAIEADLLDKLVSAADADSPVNASIIADLATKASTSDWSNFDNTTDSLEAISDMSVKSASKALTTILNGNNDIFVVAGGPVKIIELIGIVTTQIEAKSCLINYNMDPTTPAGDTAFGTDGTALEINADAVGTLYTWDGVIANDLTATTNGVALGVAAYSGLVVPAGSLELAAVVATSATGQITFYIRYEPLVSGATVTAAP